MICMGVDAYPMTVMTVMTGGSVVMALVQCI